MKRKRQSAPEVLLRAYGDRVRTFADAILSLLPQPPMCRCRGRGCLGCLGRSFLLRVGDDSEYLRLLRQGFAAVADHAPPISVFLPYRRWPHDKIVKSTIEMVLLESSEAANVICNGYDKWLCINPIVHLLTAPGWNLLLNRIGDDLFVHLLRYASIFLPLSNNNYLQVSGHPVNGSIQCSKLPKKKMSGSQLGQLKKGQTETATDEKLNGNKSVSLQQPCRSLVINESTGLQADDVIVKARKRARQFSWQRQRKRRLMNFPEVNVLHGCLATNKAKESSGEKLDKNSTAYMGHSGKCKLSIIHDVMEKMFEGSSQLCTPETIALQNDELVVDESSHCPREPVHKEAFFPLSRVVDSDLIQVSTVGNDLKVGAFKKSLSSGIFIGSGSILATLGTNKLKQYTFKTSSSFEVTSMSPSEGSFDHNKQSCPRTNFQRKVLPSGEIEKQHPLSLPSKKLLDSCSAASDCASGMYYGTCIATGKNQPTGFRGQAIQPNSICFHCLMLQAPWKVARGTQVKRRRMFYISCQPRMDDLFMKVLISLALDGPLAVTVLYGADPCLLNMLFVEWSYDAWLGSFDQERTITRKAPNILNKLKHYDSGAKSLMQHIFGVPVEHESGDSLFCSHNISICHVKQDCLYHSLISSLKTVIRRARRCQYLKLLNKHCPISVLKSYATTKGVSTSQVLKHQKTHPGLNCLGKSLGFLDIQQEGFPLKTSRSCNNEMKLSKCYCNHKEVVAFVWAACRSIIPVDLLGSCSTWRALRRNISRFVELRRYEKFSINQCIHGLKTSSFPMLAKVTMSSACILNFSLSLGHGNGDNELEAATTLLRNKIFSSWIFWFFSDFVVPLIQANFYVTESEFGRQDIFYYRKPIWKRLMNSARCNLKEQNYQSFGLLSSGEIIGKSTFGVSKVRFLPKEHGVRPIVNLKAPSKVWLPDRVCSSSKQSLGVSKEARVHCQSKILSCRGKFKKMNSSNSVLHDLFAVLNGVKVEHPSELGSAVFDYNDIYKKLCPFLVGLRNEYMLLPKVFVVTGDVFKAFDAVDQNKLLGIMKKIINNNEYHVKRYVRVSCARESLRVHYGLASVEQSSITNITNFAASVSSHSANSVFIDQVKSKQRNQEQLHNLLHDHVKHNLLQLGQSLYLQIVGIPQGSVLSSLLCSFYYGHLERNVILPSLKNSHKPSTVSCGNSGEQGVDRSLHSDKQDHVARNIESVCKNQGSCVPRHILLRLIDDFLFISTCKRQACYFLSMLKAGFEDYNCWMNEEKFRMNFNPENESGIPENMVYTGEDGVSFLPWSGLLVNCITLEIQADYTRYQNVHLSSTLTVSDQAKLSSCLKAKLCDYMRPKCHPIFYDSNINSPATIRLNAYQAFLLCAMKFHCYVCTLPKTNIFSPNFYLEIIRISFSYMYNLIKKRMRLHNCSPSHHPILQLSKDEIQWLGFSAYIRALKKKQSRYVELLSLMRYEVGKYKKMKDDFSLKYAIDDSHSSMFRKIKY